MSEAFNFHLQTIIISWKNQNMFGTSKIKDVLEYAQDRIVGTLLIWINLKNALNK